MDARYVESACESCGGLYQAYKGGSPSRWCSECRRVRDLAKAYGLSAAEWRELKSRPFCDACGELASGRMSVDHCHESGRVRGVVHQPCNVGLGQAGNSGERLWSWQLYLARSVFDLRDLCVQ